jgi:hypothetical protein
MIARSRGSRLAEGRPLHRPVIYDEIHMRRAMQGHVEGLRSYKVPLTIQHVGLCILLVATSDSVKAKEILFMLSLSPNGCAAAC